MHNHKFCCQGCGQHLEAPDDMLGEVVECPRCRSPLKVPASGTAPSSEAETKRNLSRIMLPSPIQQQAGPLGWVKTLGQLPLKVVSALLLILLLGLLSLIGFGAIRSNQPSTGSERIGVVIGIEGNVLAESGGKTARPLELAETIHAAEHLVTMANSKVCILLRDESLLYLGQETRVIVNEYVFSPDAPTACRLSLGMSNGVGRIVTGRIASLNRLGVRVTTEKSIIQIKGCDVAFRVQPGDKDDVCVLAFDSGETVTVTARPGAIGDLNQMIDGSSSPTEALNQFITLTKARSIVSITLGETGGLTQSQITPDELRSLIAAVTPEMRIPMPVPTPIPPQPPITREPPGTSSTVTTDAIVGAPSVTIATTAPQSPIATSTPQDNGVTGTHVARVSVTAPAGLRSMPIEKMDIYPPELKGSVIHCVLGSYDIVTQGKVEFTVTQSGVLYLAVNYQYQGNGGGGWGAEAWKKADFENAGWTFVAGKVNARGAKDRICDICRKNVSAGEKYAFRCNKYEPPYPIEPPAGFTLY